MGTVVGIDVGGTFTDLYLSRDGGQTAEIVKVPSIPKDPSKGVIDVLEAARVSGAEMEALVHGTTIATNAIIERRGARCALVTTKGFRDVLELGRRDRPAMYGLAGVQRPLIPRDLRWEVDERLDYRGQVIRPLVDAEVRELAAVLKQQDVEAVVVALFHAYANPAHEERIRDILLEVEPSWHVVTATGVLREYYEFERTSTAAVQGYLAPLVTRYANRLTDRLETFGTSREVLIMQSNGGVTPVKRLAQRAAHIIRSGPAAGVTAAAGLARQAGFSHVITADMGGTSFDVAAVIDGRPDVADSTKLDFRIPLRLPMIDVHTIGAGGGSIAGIDRGGLLQVGPESAGADPGPVCYGRGGTRPTVTDANVVLGRINPERPIGKAGEERLDVDGARAAMAGLGAQIGLDVEQTALAILAVVNQSMAGRIRLISVERGHDPRQFALVAFGGAGPLHGGALVREVGIGTLLVPPYPGVLCAMGCAMADLRYDYSQTLNQPIDEATADRIGQVLDGQRESGENELALSGLEFSSVKVEHVADLCFQGQIHTLRVPIEAGWSNARIVEAFIATYRRDIGSPLIGMRVVLVNLRTSVTGVRRWNASEARAVTSTKQADPEGTRKCWFDGWQDTPVYQRGNLLPGHHLKGPALIEQVDTTTVIEPGTSARVDRWNNIVVETN